MVVTWWARWLRVVTQPRAGREGDLGREEGAMEGTRMTGERGHKQGQASLGCIAPRPSVMKARHSRPSFLLPGPSHTPPGLVTRSCHSWRARSVRRGTGRIERCTRSRSPRHPRTHEATSPARRLFCRRELCVTVSFELVRVATHPHHLRGKERMKVGRPAAAACWRRRNADPRD